MTCVSFVLCAYEDIFWVRDLILVTTTARSFCAYRKKKNNKKKKNQLTQHLRVRALILVTTTKPVHLSPERKNIKEMEKDKKIYKKKKYQLLQTLFRVAQLKKKVTEKGQGFHSLFVLAWAMRGRL